MTMAVLASNLLRSQKFSYAIGAARIGRGPLAGAPESVLAEAAEHARILAGHFAAWSAVFPAANDEAPKA
ncbi:hypothetical protein H4CHR_04413 [Variovorax sp. PBS-H4]|uniref:hypothetical protein n=1 Tax=Variovorax sp. PBS-H4 TaxID=434008 RepID=UPI001317B7F3|nr:hypothetical protein [Variovorax sp. PBS-H4]VTU38390.1 hypothetical protein H4CHR_04413 [Variovorax sp. PBS-H4]